VVVVSHVQYSTGYRFVLSELAELAHAHGALLAVDATQAAGMAPELRERFDPPLVGWRGTVDPSPPATPAATAKRWRAG
jgi:hypothetical protein